MLLQIVSGIGTGPTQLSAFDDALLNAGLGNYNLLTLSSVIPPGGDIVRTDRENVKLTGRWGDRMYVVMAHQETSIPNEEV
jgi:arginine decarboxylase